MYRFWYDNFWYDALVRSTKIRRKSKTLLYGHRKFQFIDKTDDIYNGIPEDVETTFDTSNYHN